MNPIYTDKEAFDKITKARAMLIMSQPFWGALALHLIPVEEKSIPTLAVDGTHMFYNPAFIKKLNPDLVKSAVAHEVGHCVYDHIGRRGQRDPEKWNIAGDYVVNEMLKDCNFTLGEGWLFNPNYKGMTADHIYNLLPDLPPGGGPGHGQPGGALCSILPSGGQNSAQQQQMADKWKAATVQAAQAAKAQGKLPGSMKRFIDEIESPNNWRERLRAFITDIAHDDYSWQRPEKRYLASSLYIPSLWSERMGDITIVVDTSGSIDNHTLSNFAAEIKAIRASVHPQLTRVMYCDAKVAHVDEFIAEDELEMNPHGGGGTSFKPPFKWLERRGIVPKALIYLTDMYGDFPDAPPEFPVMWVATTDVQGPFGDTIRIGD